MRQQAQTPPINTKCGGSLPALHHDFHFGGPKVHQNGGQGRNRTGVDGFAGRSITTLPPGLRVEFPDRFPEARYSTIG